MIKQITVQLELPLECIYQMALFTKKAVKAGKKTIANIPAMLQLCLEFDRSNKKEIGIKKVGLFLGISAAVIIATIITIINCA